MGFTSIIFACLITFIPVESPDTLENAYIRAVITPELSGVRAGSLLELMDKETGIDLADGRQFGGIQCGGFITMDGEVQHHSSAHATFISPGMVNYNTGDELPISVTIDYSLDDRALDIKISIELTGEAELINPLEADFSAYSFTHAAFGNQTNSAERQFMLDGTHGLMRISGDQELKLVRPDSMLEAVWTFPNPAKAILAINDNASTSFLSLRFFDTEPPRENCAGPDLHSILGPGNSSSYYLRLTLDQDQRPTYFSAHPYGYERTAAWILDEMPFIHPGQGDIWGYSVTPEGDEFISAWLIQLLGDHPSLVMNWLLIGDAILAPNEDSMWCEPGYEDSWSHWHSTWRVATLATPGYKQWLLNIQNNSYYWANRVRIGNHGYHHTPSPDSAHDPYHEFITFEFDEHIERYNMIQHDLLEIGFDTCETLQTIRFPGHRTSLSGLWAIIDRGFDFYCNGVRWCDSMGGEQFLDQKITKFETEEGRIWGSNTVWWAAYTNQYPLEYVTTVMDRGKFGLLGCHPIVMWGNGDPDAYTWVDSICTSLEQDWENFGWIFPSDYSAFLEDCYQINVDSIRSGPGWNRFYFTGATGAGQHILSHVPEEIYPESVRINNVPVDWELRDGGRVFVNADGLGWNNHVLEILWTPVGVENSDSQAEAPTLYCNNPAAGRLNISIIGWNSRPVRAVLYDISGRRMLSQLCSHEPGGANTASLNIEHLPDGVYILSVEEDSGNVITKKITLLSL